MKKKLHSFFSDPSNYLDLCWIYGFAAIAVYFNFSWKLLLVYFFLFGILWLHGFHKLVQSSHDSIRFERRIRKTIKRIEKNGNVVLLYKFLENELLPELRKQLPQKIYKYYPLGDNFDKNNQKFKAIQDNVIWSSIYSEFNDPFECQYMYLTQEDFLEMGFPKSTQNLWESVMEEIRQRITTICFTQNPDCMPMWAFYANEHKGFCVEYFIEDPSQLYPVFYVDKRLKAHALFINLVYELFNQEVPIEERNISLKHIMLLSAFKHKSWASENEIRAIFLNSKADIPSKGRLCSCDEIGIYPTKIYIGAKCCGENEHTLISLAHDLNISCEKCILSQNDMFAVTKGEK